VADVVQSIMAAPTPLTFQQIAPEAQKSNLRSFNTSLGTISDLCRAGRRRRCAAFGCAARSAAEKGALRRGDTLLALGKTQLKSLHDFMFVLNPDGTVQARRQALELPVTFEERRPAQGVSRAATHPGTQSPSASASGAGTVVALTPA
jgi:hypothetical protein